MSQWPSTKARRILAALLRIGWAVKRQAHGSHRVLARPGQPDYTFAFHDREEIGTRMLADQNLQANRPETRRPMIAEADMLMISVPF